MQTHTSRLPAVIHLGAITRPPLNDYPADPRSVRSAADLPQRLFLGDLDPDSFSTGDGGWSARYTGDEPDSFVSVRSDGVPLSMNLNWRGNTSVSAVGSWNMLLQHAPLFLSELDGWSKPFFEQTFGVRYHGEDWKNGHLLAGFPDGLLKTIIVPLRSVDLTSVGGWCGSLAGRSLTMIARVVRIGVTVEQPFEAFRYVVGDPIAGDLVSIRDCGLPLSAPPEAVLGRSGDKRVRFVRPQYALYVDCVFRDLTAILTALQDFGLGARRNRYLPPVVVGAMIAMLGGRIRAEEEGRSLQYELPPAIDDIDLEEMGPDPSELLESATEQLSSISASRDRSIERLNGELRNRLMDR